MLDAGGAYMQSTATVAAAADNSASDSFSTMALYKSIYLLTYLLKPSGELSCLSVHAVNAANQ